MGIFNCLVYSKVSLPEVIWHVKHFPSVLVGNNFYRFIFHGFSNASVGYISHRDHIMPFSSYSLIYVVLE